jgi:hypothetical protein
MYPKTSCNCFQCTGEDHKFPTGVPTNLSVRNCKVSDFYDCQNRRVVGFHDAVKAKEGLNLINPQAYQEQYSTKFDQVDCDTGCGDACGVKPTYASWDPRLYSAVHNQYITLDRPPLESDVPLDQVYDKKLKRYGQGYKTYADVNAGNVLYYVDKSREDPYYSPLFAQPARVATVVYKDPMGAMKPEYPRIVPNTKLIGDTDCDNEGYCLSWIRDSQKHREDILASQMAKINQRRWEPRWSNNSK